MNVQHKLVTGERSSIVMVGSLFCDQTGPSTRNTIVSCKEKSEVAIARSMTSSLCCLLPATVTCFATNRSVRTGLRSDSPYIVTACSKSTSSYDRVNIKSALETIAKKINKLFLFLRGETSLWLY